MRGDWEISTNYFIGKIYFQENLTTNFKLLLSLLTNIAAVSQGRPANGEYFHQMLETAFLF
jgi:hypothetical protein